MSVHVTFVIYPVCEDTVSLMTLLVSCVSNLCLCIKQCHVLHATFRVIKSYMSLIFNPPPQFSRLEIPGVPCYICLFVWAMVGYCYFTFFSFSFYFLIKLHVVCYAHVFPSIFYQQISTNSMHRWECTSCEWLNCYGGTCGSVS